MTERLYIKVDENNVHIGHPRFESNMKAIYPDHDFDWGPPNGFMSFIRVEPPELGVYELFDETIGGNIALAFSHNGLSYDIVDGVYKDVWHVRNMTTEEKTEKQNSVKAAFAELHPTWSSWTFNETTCEMEPPVAYPDDGKPYTSDNENQTWNLVE